MNELHLLSPRTSDLEVQRCYRVVARRARSEIYLPPEKGTVSRLRNICFRWRVLGLREVHSCET